MNVDADMRAAQHKGADAGWFEGADRSAAYVGFILRVQRVELRADVSRKRDADRGVILRDSSELCYRQHALDHPGFGRNRRETSGIVTGKAGNSRPVQPLSGFGINH